MIVFGERELPPAERLQCLPAVCGPLAFIPPRREPAPDQARHGLFVICDKDCYGVRLAELPSPSCGTPSA